MVAQEWKLKDKFGKFVVADLTAEDIDHDAFPFVRQVHPICVIQVRRQIQKKQRIANKFISICAAAIGTR